MANADFSRYKEQSDETMEAESKKRKQAAEEQGQARQQNHGRGKGAQSSSAANSTQGRGKAGGKPKGFGNKGFGKGEAANNMGELVELQRRAVIRLLQDKRENARRTKFVIEIPDTAGDLRQHLLKGMERWQAARRDRGPLDSIERSLRATHLG